MRAYHTAVQIIEAKNARVKITDKDFGPHFMTIVSKTVPFIKQEAKEKISTITKLTNQELSNIESWTIEEMNKECEKAKSSTQTSEEIIRKLDLIKNVADEKLEKVEEESNCQLNEAKLFHKQQTESIVIGLVFLAYYNDRKPKRLELVFEKIKKMGFFLIATNQLIERIIKETCNDELHNIISLPFLLRAHPLNSIEQAMNKFSCSCADSLKQKDEIKKYFGMNSLNSQVTFLLENKNLVCCISEILKICNDFSALGAI